jgi:TolA-binding protein
MLAQKFNPEGVANRKFQQLIQNNPMILDQFANMDPAQRQAMAEGFGFKAPPASLMNLPMGPQAKARKDEEDFINSLSPEQKVEYQFTRRGLLPPADRDYKKKIEQIQLDKLTDDAGLSKILNAERTRAIQQIEAYRKANPNIDVGGLTTRLLNNRLAPGDAEQIQVLQQDLGPAFNTILEMGKFTAQNRMNMALRGAGVRDDMYRIAMSALESARKEYNDANDMLSTFVRSYPLAGTAPEMFFESNPSAKAQYDAILSRIQDAKSRFDSYLPAVRGFMKKEMGIDIPDIVTEPPPSAGTAGETPEQRRERLKKAARGM